MKTTTCSADIIILLYSRHSNNINIFPKSYTQPPWLLCRTRTYTTSSDPPTPPPRVLNTRPCRGERETSTNRDCFDCRLARGVETNQHTLTNETKHTRAHTPYVPDERTTNANARVCKRRTCFISIPDVRICIYIYYEYIIIYGVWVSQTRSRLFRRERVFSVSTKKKNNKINNLKDIYLRFHLRDTRKTFYVGS